MHPAASQSPALPQAPTRFMQGQPVQIANGTLEGLKWLALVLMTLDHVNKYVFAWGLPGAVEAGRLVMPIFGFVLAYNLARPSLAIQGYQRVTTRVMTRLLTFGALATPIYIALNTGLMHQLHPKAEDLVSWWPLNIMFTLLVSTMIIAMLRQTNQAWLVVAAASFALLAPVLEYAWFGLGFVLASWYHCRKGSVFSAGLLVLAAAALAAVNGNFYALLALPLLLLAPRIDLKMPRWRHVFYWYYPLHLATIWVWLYGASHAMRFLA